MHGDLLEIGHVVQIGRTVSRFKEQGVDTVAALQVIVPPDLRVLSINIDGRWTTGLHGRRVDRVFTVAQVNVDGAGEVVGKVQPVTPTHSVIGQVNSLQLSVVLRDPAQGQVVVASVQFQGFDRIPLAEEVVIDGAKRTIEHYFISALTAVNQVGRCQIRCIEIDRVIARACIDGVHACAAEDPVITVAGVDQIIAGAIKVNLVVAIAGIDRVALGLAGSGFDVVVTGTRGHVHARRCIRKDNNVITATGGDGHARVGYIVQDQIQGLGHAARTDGGQVLCPNVIKTNLNAFTGVGGGVCGVGDVQGGQRRIGIEVAGVKVLNRGVLVCDVNVRVLHREVEGRDIGNIQVEVAITVLVAGSYMQVQRASVCQRDSRLGIGPVVIIDLDGSASADVAQREGVLIQGIHQVIGHDTGRVGTCGKAVQGAAIE